MVDKELLVVHDRRELRQLLQGKKQVSLVQTGGRFHAGHLAVIKEAQLKSNFVVVSIYAEDLGNDRDAERDLVTTSERQAALEAGADVIFAPSTDVLYPFGRPQVAIDPGVIGSRYEGKHPGSNFGARLNQITKMINIVRPDLVFFGQRDAQLLALVRQLVRDLDLNVQVEGVPVHRDLDGLATSKQNQHLSPAQRQKATQLSAALYSGVQLAAANASATQVLDQVRSHLDESGLEVEYLDLVDPLTFTKWEAKSPATGLLIAAVTLDGIRLIDNQLVVLTRRGN